MATTAAPSVAPRSTTRPLPVGARTQVLGLALLSLAPLLMFLVGMLTGVPVGEGVVFVVIGLVLAAAAVLAWRFGTWAGIVGIVLTLAAALSGFWLAFGLFAPTSPGDFVPAVLFVAGVVLSLFGGAQAIVSRRRSRLAPTASTAESRTRTIVLAVVLAALVASVAGNLLTRSSVDAAAATGATEVSMTGFDFAPDTVTVAAGEEAALLVHNSDGFLHDLAVPQHDLLVTVSPGSQELLDVSTLEPGTYTLYCTLHSDTSESDPDAAGMAGTLVVE